MMKSQIKRTILRHAECHGVLKVPIEGLELIRVERPLPLIPSTYPASLCLLVQGEKRVHLGGEIKTYNEDAFLCCTMPLPVDAEIPRASKKRPVIGLLLSLQTQAMMETLVAAEASVAFSHSLEDAKSREGLVVCNSDDALLHALMNLLQLLDDKEARAVLQDARLREVYFALLRTDAGAAIRKTFGASRGLGRAFAFIREHLSESVSIDDLARVSGMSRAVFHRRFKEATTLSPLQFIKAIRLNTAAGLMGGGMNVSDAAEQVGYASSSQFSREFSRQYGASPREWVAQGI